MWVVGIIFHTPSRPRLEDFNPANLSIIGGLTYLVVAALIITGIVWVMRRLNPERVQDV
jgi:heme/copper-type cytochrome/quinol oxidase subunit 4